MLMQDLEMSAPLRREKTEIGPLAITSMSKDDVVRLVGTAVRSRIPLDIGICNAHTIMTALDQPAYAATLNRMTLLNDGIGIALANRIIYGKRFRENLNGTDLIPHVLAEIDLPLRIYLLGAGEKQVTAAARHIEATYPGHVVVGYRNGYFEPQDCGDICAAINKAKPDLLLVAMGNPRQEMFIAQNRHQFDATVAIGVGALFDFMSGTVARAPRFVRSLGLEWLFRLLQEPRRLFRRYVFGIPRFLIAVFRCKRSRAR
ncbi:WecB/TagA/CpsF family glycosyltransferase [Rhodobacterales bacterium]|nr:WecB/TagA/CpsF family glycosyltransferase [Rhodobacterales bacterium]